MSGRLNHAKAKRDYRTRQAVRAYPGDTDQQQPHVRPIRGWRTEWDGEPFPVEVRQVEPKTKAA